MRSQPTSQSRIYFGEYAVCRSDFWRPDQASDKLEIVLASIGSCAGAAVVQMNISTNRSQPLHGSLQAENRAAMASSCTFCRHAAVDGATALHVRARAHEDHKTTNTLGSRNLLEMSAGHI